MEAHNGSTPVKAGSRTIRVDMLARVEGEGALTVKINSDGVQDVQFRIFEPPRFFEGFLRGREYSEVPDITARICGICPVAYQMSAVNALEALFGVRVDGALRVCGGCCTAANGSRATRCTSTCCTRRTFWVTPT